MYSNITDDVMTTRRKRPGSQEAAQLSQSLLGATVATLQRRRAVCCGGATERPV